MQKLLEFSEHASQRAAQRNLSDEDVWYVIDHGTRFYSGGALHVFLAKRDVRRADMSNDRITRLIGATLVMDSDGFLLITVYRNTRASQKIRKKMKYNLKAA